MVGGGPAHHLRTLHPFPSPIPFLFLFLLLVLHSVCFVPDPSRIPRLKYPVVLLLFFWILDRGQIRTLANPIGQGLRTGGASKHFLPWGFRFLLFLF